MALFSKKSESKKTDTVTKKKVAHAVKRTNGSAHELLRAPWYTEKALLLTEKGIYTFEVSARATTAEIAGAVKEIYNVTPREVRIVNLPAKKKALRGRRGQGARAARHKAYVTLNPGETISFA